VVNVSHAITAFVHTTSSSLKKICKIAHAAFLAFEALAFGCLSRWVFFPILESQMFVVVALTLAYFLQFVKHQHQYDVMAKHHFFHLIFYVPCIIYVFT
jgi:hypothetical protein